MKHKAYSYVRFSTPEQLKGKSLERQTEAAQVYCKQHGLILDTELTLHDLGVSAFRGKNADTGALGAFLKAVHAGSVDKGSFLLIETFDRMSRESAYDAQLTLQNIITAGITVVTLMDGKQYNVGILRQDPIALIYAILLMSRSHEESATKSKRVADAWRRKRERLARGEKLTRNIPGWISIDKHGKFSLNKHAATIELIFNLYLGGHGHNAIATELNAKKIPTLKPHAQMWGPAVVGSCLRNRAVIGEFQAHTGDPQSPKRRRVPVGEPIRNYFPAAIKPRIFERAQQRAKIKATATRAPTVPSKYTLKNIFAGLARCNICGARMGRFSSRESQALLVCVKARSGLCSFRSVRTHIIESALISQCEILVAEIPVPDEALQRKISITETALKEELARVSDLGLLLDDTPSRVIAQRLKVGEDNCERLKMELEALQIQAQYGNARRVKDAVKNMQTALKWYATDPGDVKQVNASLRECFSQIVMDVPGRQMSLHWRHGGATALTF